MILLIVVFAVLMIIGAPVGLSLLAVPSLIWLQAAILFNRLFKLLQAPSATLLP